MSETTKTTDSAATAPAETATVAEEAFNADAGIEGAAAFADAESREILNLLGDADGAGSCCGGSCCSV